MLKIMLRVFGNLSIDLGLGMLVSYYYYYYRQVVNWHLTYQMTRLFGNFLTRINISMCYWLISFLSCLSWSNDKCKIDTSSYIFENVNYEKWVFFTLVTWKMSCLILVSIYFNKKLLFFVICQSHSFSYIFFNKLQYMVIIF